MSSYAIRAEGLSKKFRVVGPTAKYGTLRDSIADGIKAPLRALRRRRSDRREAKRQSEFWALRDVSFEIEPGEVVGVIGRNGAGKSTLLKVLSRITEPTEGGVDIYGRVGSLLEVGTGFHMELSGRENIFLNGAILGMGRSEIASKFDQIVQFAEVERFIDTAVKHYSSGMYLRLAFAVAAHLEPEILLVDEVLAVGDLEFQRKCLGKMNDVASQGRTVLFVSHNLGTVRQLCRTSLVMDKGQVGFRGGVSEGLAHYTRILERDDNEDGPTRSSGFSRIRVYNRGPNAKGSEPATAASTSAAASDNSEIESDGEISDPIDSTDPFGVTARLELREAIAKGRLYCIIDDADGACLAHNFLELRGLDEGRHDLRAEWPPIWLKPGAYSLHLKLIASTPSGESVRLISNHVLLDITERDGQTAGKVKAILIPRVEWTLGDR